MSRGPSDQAFHGRRFNGYGPARGGLEWSPDWYRQLGNKSRSAQRFCLRLSEIRPVAEDVKCGAGGGAAIRSAPGRGR